MICAVRTSYPAKGTQATGLGMHVSAYSQKTV